MAQLSGTFTAVFFPHATSEEETNAHHSGLKVQNAQNFGMIGVVMFNDPADDGEITEENGYEAYPDGPARNPVSQVVDLCRCE